MKLKSLLFLSLLFLCISASAQTAEELCAKGLEYYFAGDYTKAVELYRKGAEQGYAKAQYNLALCYGKGEGVTENYSEAVKWLKKAAVQGDSGAINALKQLGEM